MTAVSKLRTMRFPHHTIPVTKPSFGFVVSDSFLLPVAVREPQLLEDCTLKIPNTPLFVLSVHELKLVNKWNKYRYGGILLRKICTANGSGKTRSSSWIEDQVNLLLVLARLAFAVNLKHYPLAAKIYVFTRSLLPPLITSQAYAGLISEPLATPEVVRLVTLPILTSATAE